MTFANPHEKTRRSGRVGLARCWYALLGKAGNLSVEIPTRLFQILNLIAFVAGPPDVFDGVTPAEIHVLGHLNTLNAARVRRVVGRVIDQINGQLAGRVGIRRSIQRENCIHDGALPRLAWRLPTRAESNQARLGAAPSAKYGACWPGLIPAGRPSEERPLHWRKSTGPSNFTNARPLSDTAVSCVSFHAAASKSPIARNRV